MDRVEKHPFGMLEQSSASGLECYRENVFVIEQSKKKQKKKKKSVNIRSATRAWPATIAKMGYWSIDLKHKSSIGPDEVFSIPWWWLLINITPKIATVNWVYHPEDIWMALPSKLMRHNTAKKAGKWASALFGRRRKLRQCFKAKQESISMCAEL